LLSTSRQNQIRLAIERLDKFCFESYKNNLDHVIDEALKNRDPTELMLDVLQEWINSVELDRATINGYFSGVRKYLYYNRIKITSEDIQNSVIFPKKIREEKKPLLMSEIREIISSSSFKKQGFYLTMLSTGARPEEILSLRKKDIDITGNRIKVNIRAEFTKKKFARSSYCSIECNKYVLPVLKKIGDDDFVFGKNPKIGHAVINEDTILARKLDKLGLGERYDSTKYHKINLTSFRAFFHTKVANIYGLEFAHRLSGHDKYLPNYDRKTDEEFLEIFLKIEPELLVFDTSKAQAKIKNLEYENKELVKAKMNIDQMKEAILDELLKRMEKKD